MANESEAKAKEKRSDEISRSKSTDTKGRNTASEGKPVGQEEGGTRIEIIVSSSPSNIRRATSERNIMQMYTSKARIAQY